MHAFKALKDVHGVQKKASKKNRTLQDILYHQPHPQGLFVWQKARVLEG